MCIDYCSGPYPKSFWPSKLDHKSKAINFEEKPILNHYIGYAVISPNFFNKLSKKIVNLKDGKGIIQAIKFNFKKTSKYI